MKAFAVVFEGRMPSKSDIEDCLLGLPGINILQIINNSAEFDGRVDDEDTIEEPDFEEEPFVVTRYALPAWYTTRKTRMGVLSSEAFNRLAFMMKALDDEFDSDDFQYEIVEEYLRGERIIPVGLRPIFERTYHEYCEQENLAQEVVVQQWSDNKFTLAGNDTILMIEDVLFEKDFDPKILEDPTIAIKVWTLTSDSEAAVPRDMP